MCGASAGGSADTLKQGAKLTQHSQRKPSDYEVPISPSCSTSSVPSPTTTDMKESRYVSTPKLPQDESEAVDAEGTQVLPSTLQREMIAEHYEFEGDGGIVMTPGAEEVVSEYTYIDENEINSPSGYEYIDENDLESHLINEKVSS